MPQYFTPQHFALNPSSDDDRFATPAGPAGTDSEGSAAQAVANPRPIRSRLLLVGTIVVTAIIAAAGLIVEMQRRASIDAFRTATVNLGNGMSQQTTRSLSIVDAALTETLADLATGPHTTIADIQAAMRQRQTFDKLVERQKHLAGVVSLGLIDAAGKIASSSTGWPAIPLDILGSEDFHQASTTGDDAVFVSEPVKDRDTGRWTAFMVRRIDNARGQFAGAAVGQISLTDLQSFYQLAMPANRSIYILRRDGTIMVRYPPRDEEIGKKIPQDSPWYETVDQGGGTYQGPGYFDGTPVIASVHPMRKLPFVIEASVTEAATLSAWYQQRLWVALGSVAAEACVVILLRLFGNQYRRVERSELSLADKNSELATAHGQLDATLANLSQGVALYSEDIRLVVCNRRYLELFDLPADSVLPGTSLAEIAELRAAAGSLSAGSVPEYMAFITAILDAGKPHEMTNHLANGRVLHLHLDPMPAHGGWVVTTEDITERCLAEEKIAFLARHDVLTGLANRALFQERLEQALAMAERGRGFAVLCLDLDRFKAVNDTLGHPAGDSLLKAVAVRLRAAMREVDTIARLGGDEFAILQMGVSDPAEVTTVARRIVQAITEPYDLDGAQASVGTSIGIAMAPGDSAHPVQLMKHADLALYRAKQEGRGTWRFFEPAMDAVARTRRALETDLRGALQLGQLELHYQPLVSSQSRTVQGFEALLRWRHPTRGLVPPVEFISVAEEIGLIADIGSWVLQQACAQAATWPGNLRVAVNLSTRQFRGRALFGAVADAIQAAGLSPSRVELEITESVPLQQDQATLSILHDLHALGTRITLDDFGTGYSSLSYLRSFPFDTIKIDRSFVSDLETRDESIAIIRGIIGLATNLRMSVTAEGVETEGQYKFLAASGCTEIQGYLISRPVPADDVAALIERLSAPRAVKQDQSTWADA